MFNGLAVSRCGYAEFCFNFFDARGYAILHTCRACAAPNYCDQTYEPNNDEAPHVMILLCFSRSAHSQFEAQNTKRELAGARDEQQDKVKHDALIILVVLKDRAV